MYLRLSDILEERFDVDPDWTERIAHFVVVLCAAITFALCCTVIVAFDDIFLGFNSVANLNIGKVPTDDIIAREEGLLFQ